MYDGAIVPRSDDLDGPLCSFDSQPVATKFCRCLYCYFGVKLIPCLDNCCQDDIYIYSYI